MQAKQTEQNTRTVWKVFTVRNCSYGLYGSCTDRRSKLRPVTVRVYWTCVSSNGHDPKPWCCWSENRNSLLTTDPGVVQRCWFDRFVQFVEWTRPETWMLSIGKSHLITHNRPGSRFITKALWKSTYKHMNTPLDKSSIKIHHSTNRAIRKIPFSDGIYSTVSDNPRLIPSQKYCHKCILTKDV